MNIEKYYRLKKAMEERTEYAKIGDDDGNVQFGKLERLDKAILELIKEVYR